MEQIECSETSAYKIQMPENHPEENIQHTEHGGSLKYSGVTIHGAHIASSCVDSTIIIISFCYSKSVNTITVLVKSPECLLMCMSLYLVLLNVIRIIRGLN
jgi:hypothetical protein